MGYAGLTLRHLTFLSPSRPPSSVTFEKGLNVVQGASDTGKSFLVSAIDYMLGASSLKWIPERKDYTTVLLGIETAEGKTFTLERGVEGANFRCYEGLHYDLDSEPNERRTLGSKHNPKSANNISRFILELIKLDNRFLKKNKENKKETLSLRELVKLVIVDETNIHKEGSLFLSEQYTEKTKTRSLFKLLLTGVDDSALIPLQEAKDNIAKIKGKIEALEDLIGKYQKELNEAFGCVNLQDLELDLIDQLAKLEETLQRHKSVIALSEEEFAKLTARRKELWNECLNKDNRLGEINVFLERFSLLKTQYESDLERLNAIQEAGTFFVYQHTQECPACGAPSAFQDKSKKCENDVEAVVCAAAAEMEKIRVNVHGLLQTMSDITTEREELEISFSESRLAFEKIKKEIEETVSPMLNDSRSSYSSLVEKRSEILSTQRLLTQLTELMIKKKNLEESEEGKSQPSEGQTVLPTENLEDLSNIIAGMLKRWHLPESGAVYFDDRHKVHDFVISGKPRGSGGQGVLAITHAAFSCSLLTYCVQNDLPHPGFVVLDSPLMAYKEAESEEGVSEEVQSILGSDLKEQFYRELALAQASQQVIIFENEAPPKELISHISFIKFTKLPNEGRYGFFPYQGKRKKVVTDQLGLFS